MKRTSLFALVFLALLFLAAAPSVSRASFLLGVEPETQTASTLAANSSWLDIKVNGSDGPVEVYDGMAAQLDWSAPDFFNTSNCSITLPGESGVVTESVSFSGSGTAALYPSNSPLGYVEFTCTHSGQMGHDVVLITKIEKPAGTAQATSTTHGGVGVGPGSVGGNSGIQVIQFGVPVTSGNTFRYTGTGGGSSGSINFGGMIQNITNAAGNVQGTVSGLTNGIASGILGNRAANALSHGLGVANNAVNTYFTQPTTNWIANHVPIVGSLLNWLGLGGRSPATGQGGAGAPSGSGTGNPTGSGAPAGNANRNTHNGAAGSAGGTYQVHVGPLSNGGSDTTGANSDSIGTDNKNDQSNPYGFEQDPSKVQNTNDSH